MSVEPKIKTNQNIQKLRQAYLEDKMSTVDIETNSEKLFGIYVSRGTIYKELIRNNIAIRNKSTSVSRAMSTLNIDKTFMNDDLLEWIDGFLLGDGYISFKDDYSNSRFIIGSSAIEWTEYAISKFTDYDPSKIETYNEICERRPNPIWESKTKSHPDIVIQAKRWYDGVNQKKKIPSDIKITPISVMLWYLGDGSYTYVEQGNSSVLRLATCSFDRKDIESILLPKLAEHSIIGTVDDFKNDIYIKSESIKDFFNFIGWKSPIACYDHKFAVPEWLKLIRLSEIVKDDKEKWRAQYYCKMGKIECSKSPGGKMLLFTRDQADKLRNILV